MHFSGAAAATAAALRVPCPPAAPAAALQAHCHIPDPAPAALTSSFVYVSCGLLQARAKRCIMPPMGALEYWVSWPAGMPRAAMDHVGAGQIMREKHKSGWQLAQSTKHTNGTWARGTHSRAFQKQLEDERPNSSDAPDSARPPLGMQHQGHAPAISTLPLCSSAAAGEWQGQNIKGCAARLKAHL